MLNSILLNSFNHALTFRKKTIKQLKYEVDILIKEFQEKFPSSKLHLLTYETYALGHGEDTFSYWLEFKTSDIIGSIRGGSASKHGIYKGKDGNPRIVSKFNRGTIVESMDYLRNSLIELIEAGKEYNIEEINESIISPSVRYKALFMYFPEKFLPMFSEAHYDYLLNKLGIMNQTVKGIIYKQIILIEYKNSHEEFKHLSNYEFIQFLYYLYGVPKRVRDNDEKYKIDGGILNENSTYFSNTEVEAFDINVTTHIKSAVERNRIVRIDYIEKQKQNMFTGNKGEQIVLDYEMKRLSKYKNLREKVKRVSLENDVLGYDILSYEVSGEQRLIEVKSTVLKLNEIGSFFISRNEMIRSELENYWIYYVTEINSNHPKIYKIKGPINENSFLIEPINYLVSFKINGDIK